MDFQFYNIKFTQEFYEKLKRKAKLKNMTIAGYIRHCIVSCWEREVD